MKKTSTQNSSKINTLKASIAPMVVGGGGGTRSAFKNTKLKLMMIIALVGFVPLLRFVSPSFGGVGEAFAQNIAINSTGATAHASALLDLNALPSNSTGFLMPRLSTTQRLAITSPANGLMVFDTLLSGVYYFSSITSKWDCLNTPAGTVQHFANVTAPLGYLECNGQSVSATTYPELFNAIGYTYGGSGSGSSFNLPDLRGEFVRGWDNGRGVDASRVLGSGQLDDFKSHDHKVKTFQAGASVGTSNYASSYGSSNSNIGTTSIVGGTETRPRNVALMPCIKY